MDDEKKKAEEQFEALEVVDKTEFNDDEKKKAEEQFEALEVVDKTEFNDDEFIDEKNNK